jgi:hypothetical protein
MGCWKQGQLGGGEPEVSKSCFKTMLLRLERAEIVRVIEFQGHPLFNLEISS